MWGKAEEISVYCLFDSQHIAKEANDLKSDKCTDFPEKKTHGERSNVARAMERFSIYFSYKPPAASKDGYIDGKIPQFSRVKFHYGIKCNQNIGGAKNIIKIFFTLPMQEFWVANEVKSVAEKDSFSLVLSIKKIYKKKEFNWFWSWRKEIMWIATAFVARDIEQLLCISEIWERISFLVICRSVVKTFHSGTEGIEQEKISAIWVE